MHELTSLSHQLSGFRSPALSTAAVLLLLVLSAGCAGGPEEVRGELLAQYPVVAVTGVEVQVAAQKSQEEQVTIPIARRGDSADERAERLDRLTSFIASLDPDSARSVRRSLRRLSAFLSGGDGESRPGRRAAIRRVFGSDAPPPEEVVEPGLYEYTVDRLNRGFSRRGYMPIQRERIDAVTEEQKMALSGQTAGDVELGRLVQADAVVRGTLTVRFLPNDSLGSRMKQLFGQEKSPCELLFSGDITTVDQGYILYSHAVSMEREDFSAEGVEQVVDLWFEELPSITAARR